MLGENFWLVKGAYIGVCQIDLIKVLPGLAAVSQLLLWNRFAEVRLWLLARTTMSHSFPFCYSTLGFFFLPLFTSFLSLILFSCACLTGLSWGEVRWVKAEADKEKTERLRKENLELESRVASYQQVPDFSLFPFKFYLLKPSRPSQAPHPSY